MAEPTLTDSLLKFVRDVAGDKEVKTELLTSAITGVTGIAPVVDKSNPQVTFIRLRPQHGKQVEALLFRRVKKTPTGAIATVKLDVAPAVRPLIFKYAVLPAIGIFALGYFVNDYFARKGY